MRALTLALLLLAGTVVAARAQSDALIVDLSEDLIAITTGFTGSDVLLFGATDNDGDVIVVVRGPESDIVVRRKERVAGIWINRDEVKFGAVPSFYHVAASAPISELLPIEDLQREQIGADQLSLVPLVGTRADGGGQFREALVRNKQRQALYSPNYGIISFIGGRLFRTRVSFPANVPTGRYATDVYLVRDNAIVSKTTTPLQVRKLGFEANMFAFAHERSLLYGLIAILVALVAGWFAGFVFRKA